MTDPPPSGGSDRPAVLLLAYGSPASEADMATYLADVREGRPPSPELVAEMQARYRAIGGSPLNRHTLAQADALARELAGRRRGVPVYVGMRHWTPRIAEAIARMQADGVTRAVAIALAPHYTALSGGRYAQRVEEALQATGATFPVRPVRSWWAQPGWIEAWARRVRAGAERLSGAGDGPLNVIFTAHSLPTRVRAMGDDYEGQLRENAARIAARADVADWTFAFQSAGASPEPWLGPSIEAVLPDLAAAGCRRELVVPIGFVCDHVEVLYDIDIEARGIAESSGITLERATMPNDAPDFMAALADVAEAALAGRPEPAA